MLNALSEVSSTLIQRTKLRDITAIQSEAVEAYHTAVKLSFERYRTGLSNYIEVLYAQQNLYPAQIQLSQYYYQHCQHAGIPVHGTGRRLEHEPQGYHGRPFQAIKKDVPQNGGFF